MESIIYVGIDVHKDTYSLCSFDMQKHTSAGVHITIGCTAGGLTRCRLQTFVMTELFQFYVMRNYILIFSIFQKKSVWYFPKLNET